MRNQCGEIKKNFSAISPKGDSVIISRDCAGKCGTAVGIVATTGMGIPETADHVPKLILVQVSDGFLVKREFG
jgi:hypothetical protein